jgi:hypothetical protein
MGGVLQLDNASLVMTALMYDHEWKIVVVGIAFTMFSLLASLLMLQMLIGVMCDVVSKVGAEQRAAASVAMVKQELLEEFTKRDNGDGRISRQEFDECLNGQSCRAVLKHLRINPLFFTELANLFYTDDSGDSQKRVPIKTILELLVMCKGDNVATVELVATCICFLNNMLTEMEERLMDHMHHIKILVTPVQREETIENV